MIKICIVVNSLMFGGVERVIENYYENFDRSKYEITLIAQDNSVKEDIEIFEKMGMRILIVPHKRKHPLKNYFGIKRILKQNRFDIVHSNMSFTNCYVLRFAKIYKARIRINHYHNVFQFKGLKKLFVSILNKQCDKYATCNFFCSDAVSRYIGKTKHPSVVCRNALNLAKYEFNAQIRQEVREDLGVSDDIYLLGQVGRLTSQKNQLFTLAVFSELIKLDDKFRLVFVGDGEDRQLLEDRAVADNIADKVRFIPACNDVEKYYSAFDSVVLPSKYEGLGIVAVESSLSGATTLVSKAFPDEIKLANNITFLDDSIDEWVKALLIKTYHDRNNVSLSTYKNNGYDIEIERKKLFEFYEHNI